MSAVDTDNSFTRAVVFLVDSAVATLVKVLPEEVNARWRSF
jgi:hypothetical protein